MSIKRRCPNCFRNESIRFNFGDDIDAEKTFHNLNWCDCGYESPEEMMLNQDMGFTDPRWIPIAKYFLDNYHLRLRQGHIQNKDEIVRFFLKLLKSATTNCGASIELVNSNKDEEWSFIYNGKAEYTPRVNIFDSEDFLTGFFNLKHSISTEKNKVSKKSKVKAILDKLMNKEK